MDLSNIDMSGLLSTFGIGGVLIWYLYYTTSVTLPKLHEHYAEVLNGMAKEFTQALKDEREAFRETARDGRCLLRVDQLKKLGE